jgi:hypothetical protein
MDRQEALLREEIEFWQLLIGEKQSRREPIDPRMRDALTLAKYKLERYRVMREGVEISFKIPDANRHLH